MSRLLSYPFFLMLLMLLNARTVCAEDGETRISIGAILPYSGPFERYGALVRRGLELGRSPNVSILYEDEACEPGPAVKSYQKLAAVNGIRVYFGPLCGSPQSAIAPLLRKAGHIALLGASASERLFDISGGRMFSVQHSIEAESAFIANAMNARGLETVVLIFSESDYARSHEASFLKAYRGRVLDTIAFTTDLGSVKSSALRIKELHPSAVFAPDASPLMMGLLREMGALRLQGIPVWSVYSAQSHDVSEAITGSPVPLIYSYPDIGANDALEYFPRRAMEILSSAANQCGTVPDCIQRYLREHYPFNNVGVLEGAHLLKTFDGKQFVPLR